MNEEAKYLRDILKSQLRIEYLLGEVLKGQSTMATALEELAAAVAQTTTVESSAIQLIQGLASQISAAATDPAKVSALASQLSSNASALAAAIAANTVAAPATPTP